MVLTPAQFCWSGAAIGANKPVEVFVMVFAASDAVSNMPDDDRESVSVAFAAMVALVLSIFRPKRLVHG